MCFIIAGCTRIDIKKNITSEQCVISPKGVEWLLEPAFVNRGRSTYLLMISEDIWNVEPPWQELIVNDRRIRLWAQLEDKNGNVYKTEIVGSASGEINLRFSDKLPRHSSFTKLSIFSSEDFPVERINLHSRNFN